MGFLDDFFRKEDDPTRSNDLEKNVVFHDKWDQESYDSLMKEMPEFSAAEDRLTDAVSTGGSAYADMFFALLKADPRLIPPKQVRASHQVNRLVMGEAMDLTEYESMRSYCQGDEIGTALATVGMEPELETLFDRLKQEQKLAQELQAQHDQMHGLEEEKQDLDEMIQQMQSGEGEGAGDADPVDLQDQASQIAEAMERLQDQIDMTEQQLEQALQQAGPGVRAAMKQALKQALKDATDVDQAAQTWGLDPGTLMRLDPHKRIEMARKLKNERFKRIAQLFGPMHRMAFAEQQRKTIHSNDEYYDVEIGSDLARVLPGELMQLGDPDLELQFIRKYFEGELLQYKMRGEEKLAKGGIIVCEDGSGSMAGDSEIWAKAVGLTLMQIAKSQNRSFYGIHFGGPGMIKQFDFRDPKNATFEQVIEFAELFFNGGTDFVTPLSKALDIMNEEYAAKGCVKSDIVFITDGMCGVPAPWLEQFKEAQEQLAFRVYGVVIGGSPDSEPLKTICDGRVLTVRQLTTGDDLRDIFRSL